MLAIPASMRSALKLTPVASTSRLKTAGDTEAFQIVAVSTKGTDNLRAGELVKALLVPIADAGCDGAPYRIWLPLSGALPN
jgi:hypothetical protein